MREGPTDWSTVPSALVAARTAIWPRRPLVSLASAWLRRTTNARADAQDGPEDRVANRDPGVSSDRFRDLPGD